MTNSIDCYDLSGVWASYVIPKYQKKSGNKKLLLQTHYEIKCLHILSLCCIRTFSRHFIPLHRSHLLGLTVICLVESFSAEIPETKIGLL